MQNKITTAHMRRQAVVYVRQSSVTQMVQNLESQRRQYALVDHAKGLGFGSVEVVDEDLGRSGSGLVERPGFQRLVAMVCAGKVGAVLCIEASRLARNGRDWHHLIELCGLVDTLVIDPDGIYNPQQINDRLLLGLKGTMSEFELNLLRQRSLEAARQKARRGELQFGLPAGYCWTHHDKIEMEPDRRIQQAILSVFSKFTELGSARQVLLWFRGEQISLPVIAYNEFGRTIVWRQPAYRTIHSILTNPIFAGAYAFGKTEARITVVNGKARRTDGHSKPRQQWMVLIRDHHPEYISWDQFERNQMVITENAHSKSCFSRKSGRGGRSLLIGLLRCGRCGRMLHVAYSGTLGNVPRYHCRGALINHGGDSCISFGGFKVDRTVALEVLKAISSSAMEAALKAVESRAQQTIQQKKNMLLELEQSQYEVRLAARRYEAVDPENRLVAAELESRWNAAISKVHALEKTLAQIEAEHAAIVIPEREALLRLSMDLPAVWDAPATDMRLKQRIVSMLIQEIVADVDQAAQEIALTIHWMGGRHSELRITKNITGRHTRCTNLDAIEVIRQMAGKYKDKVIAATLNRLGFRTGMGNTWEEHRVRTARSHFRLPAYDPVATDDLTLTLDQAAKQLGISARATRRLVEEHFLPAAQIVPCAPWQIQRADLESPAVKQAVDDIRNKRRRKPRASSDDNSMTLFSVV